MAKDSLVGERVEPPALDDLIELIRNLTEKKVTGHLDIDFVSGILRWNLPKVDVLYNPTAQDVEAVIASRGK